ncbi:transposase [Xylanimonas protaetiae]|uniref:Transposase n=1 Tax=Xylanimonas protaetiae TaxID=2509457 RepID=A0A4P6F1C0_9MICO|nr:transposase [Xylanimonas protaetiae]QAY68905.1 transposase [Xylanimonas protaetiae]
MARKNYSEEFRSDAVELYRSTAGATIKQIADELGIHDATLSSWLKTAGVSVRSVSSASVTSPPSSRGGGVETPEQENARLRAQVARLEADLKRTEVEKDILKKAAKYFAAETNW